MAGWRAKLLTCIDSSHFILRNVYHYTTAPPIKRYQLMGTTCSPHDAVAANPDKIGAFSEKYLAPHFLPLSLR